ncbi:MAG: hypothetical protein WC599_10410 [Bacteroidales bacterium]
MTTQFKKQAPRFAYFPEAQNLDLFPLFIALIVVLSYGKILFLRDVFWDDNCWLLAEFSSGNLEQFLNTGFYEMRRASLGIFLHYFFNLHKTTDYAYLIWHSIDMSIQILTPIFLYFFLKNLFREKQLLSLFIAVSLVVFPLDNTLPYLSSVNYRIAILLSIISFYLTERALGGSSNHWPLFILSLLISGLSYYVFMEATIVFEPARLFVIGYIFYKKGIDGKSLIKKSLKYSLPFFILCIPLVLYKLTYKSYGIYGGKYKTDIFFFLNWKEHAKLVRTFMFYQWKVLAEYIRDVKMWSLILSVFAIILSFLMAKKISGIDRHVSGNANALMKRSFKNEFKDAWGSVRIVFLAGISFLVPAVLFTEFARLEIGPGLNSSHFTLLQIGYAIVLGCLIYAFYTAFLNYYARLRLLSFFLAAVIGAGVFFNNLNLDMYFNSWEKQTQFWKLFTKRFPSLPENATFMMDVRDPYYYDTPDLDNTYDLEYAINLLYADSGNPGKFRRYKVIALEEISPAVGKYECNQTGESKIERETHFGKELLEPCKFIVVYYRDGELLVNREIKKKYPDIPYRIWLEKDFPKLPEPVSYPLRHKFYGYRRI